MTTAIHTIEFSYGRFGWAIVWVVLLYVFSPVVLGITWISIAAAAVFALVPALVLALPGEHPDIPRIWFIGWIAWVVLIESLFPVIPVLVLETELDWFQTWPLTFLLPAIGIIVYLLIHVRFLSIPIDRLRITLLFLPTLPSIVFYSLLSHSFGIPLSSGVVWAAVLLPIPHTLLLYFCWLKLYRLNGAE